jgi:hypothetical protein
LSADTACDRLNNVAQVVQGQLTDIAAMQGSKPQGGSSTKLAVVRGNTPGISTSYLHGVEPAHGPGLIPGLTGAHFVPLASLGGGSGRRPAHYRAAGRAARRLAGFGTFLGTERFNDADCFVCFDVGGHQVAFGRTLLDRRPWFLHLRDAGELPCGPPGPDRIQIITGTCLFSARTLWMIDESGTEFPVLSPECTLPDRPLAAIHCDDELSIYEYQSAIRLGRTAADLIGVLPTGMPVTITLDIPRVQYFCYLLDAFERQLVDSTLIGHWFDIVDRRNHQLSELFIDLISSELDDPDSHVAIDAADPLAAIETYLRQAVASGTAPSLDYAVDLLARSGDPMWAQLLTVAPPATWTDLTYASYSVTPLRTLTDPVGTGRALVLHVENYEEWPALNATRRVLKRLRDSGHANRSGWLAGLYPMQQLIVTDESGRWIDFYYHDPGPHAIDSRGRLVNLVDLVDELYSPSIPLRDER